MEQNEALPPVNWPQKSGEYKVVQLQLDGKHYLRFRQDDWELTHNLILRNFLEAQGIEPRTFRTHTDETVPETRGERYIADGMGKARVNVEQKRASFYGESYDYGIGISRTHLEQIRHLEPGWQIE